MNRHSYCMILTTTGEQVEAKNLAAMLVKAQLAACVQTTSITSTYTWQDELHQESEWLLVIKTRTDLYNEVEQTIREHHSYDTPEIVQVPITQGSPAYLAWLDANTIS